MEYVFSDYASYLGAAFALNLMFGLWDKLHLGFGSKLAAYHAMLITRMRAILVDVPDNRDDRKWQIEQIERSEKTLNQRGNSYKLNCDKCIRWIKPACLLAATAIGVCFFAFAGKDGEITLSLRYLIGASPAPPLIAFSIFYAYYWGVRLKSRKLVNNTIELTGDPKPGPEGQGGIKDEWDTDKDSGK